MAGGRRGKSTKEKPLLQTADLHRLMSDVLNIADVELLTLKAHLLVEAALRHLLCARLELRSDVLPRLSFWTLSHLAMSGMRERWGAGPLRAVLALNEIRNAYAHHVAPSDQTKRLREIAELPTGIQSLQALWQKLPGDLLIRYRCGLAVTLAYVDSMRERLLEDRKASGKSADA